MSHDKRIDPVGACVGMKGIRIQAVVRELNNEKIDIVHWSSDAEIYIKRAMSPVTPLLVIVDEESKTAATIVPDDQIQFAIGRRGQNIRLASQLTGYNLQPIKESEYVSADELAILEVAELDEVTKQKLLDGGYETAESALDAGIDKLMEVPGIDRTIAENILAVLSAYFIEAESAKDAEASAAVSAPAAAQVPEPESAVPAGNDSHH
jgi:N utilization substance protein A